MIQARQLPYAPLHRPSPEGDLCGSSLGVQLKTYFDGLTEGPVPERLLRLAEQLEAALERGELRCTGDPARRR